MLQKRAMLEADEWAHILRAQEQLVQAKGVHRIAKLHSVSST